MFAGFVSECDRERGRNEVYIFQNHTAYNGGGPMMGYCPGVLLAFGRESAHRCSCERVCDNHHNFDVHWCKDIIKIKNKQPEVLGQGNEHNFWLGPEFERQADFWAKFVQEADPWLLFIFFSGHSAGNYS